MFWKKRKKFFYWKISIVLLFIGFAYHAIAIDLDFSIHPAVKAAFPCMDTCWYDVRFNTTGNDFDGVLFWSGVKLLTGTDYLPPHLGGESVSGVVLYISGQLSSCPLDTCKYDTIVCRRQVQGLWYNKQRGERLLPLDSDSHKILKQLENTYATDPNLPIVGYKNLYMTGGWFTDCTGVYDPVKRYKPNINPKGIFGQIYRALYTGTVFAPQYEERNGSLYAGLEYDYEANEIATGKYTFKNNLLFINTRGDYLCHSGDLQGVGFDTAGGVFSFSVLASCVFPGDGVVVPHGAQVTGYWHNDKPRLPPVRDSVLLQCFNGEFIGGNTGYIYSTPLDCKFPGDNITVKHGQVVSGYARQYVPFGLASTLTQYWQDIQANTGAAPYGYENVLCWDGALSGDSRFVYGTSAVLPPEDCIVSGTQQKVLHGHIFTGYKVVATTHTSSGECAKYAVFQCNNGVFEVQTIAGGGETGVVLGVFNAGKNYVYPTCTVLSPQSCLLPWGGELPHGATGYAYLKSEVLQGVETCTGQVISCTDGVLSGTYKYPSCQAVAIDRTPNHINCAVIDNVPQNQYVTFPAYLITGMTPGYTGYITLGSGLSPTSVLTGSSGAILIKNGVEIGRTGVVQNGDIISLKLLAPSGYKVTRSIPIQVGDMQALCVITTAPEVGQSFANPLAGVELTRDMKFNIWKQYMRLLSRYADEAYNMCRVTESLQKIIGRMLFETNKNILLTSNDQQKRREYFRKLILEYLLEITRVYRSRVVTEITKVVAGKVATYKEVGCTRRQ